MSALTKLFYHNMRIAYIRGEKSESKFWLSHIMSRAQECEDAFCDFSSKDVAELERLAKCINSDIYAFVVPQINAATVCRKQTHPDHRCAVEKDIVEALTQDNGAEISKIIGVPVTPYDTEYKTQYGRIDLLLKGDRTICIVETKKDIANHAVIGQMIKYMQHFETRLMWNLWDNIVSVVISAGFDNYTLRSISQIGSIAAIYAKTKNGICLTPLVYVEE